LRRKGHWLEGCSCSHPAGITSLRDETVRDLRCVCLCPL
jgi:hypothetical protein